MISFLNPKLNYAVAVVCFVLAAYFYVSNNTSLLTFVAGATVAFPLTIRTWQSIEKNWPNLYKKFYSKNFYRREKKLVKESIKLTWWVIPWNFAIYTVLSFAILRYSSDFSLLASMTAGSVFATCTINYQKCPKYYKELCR